MLKVGRRVCILITWEQKVDEKRKGGYIVKVIFVEQHSMAGHVINYKDGGIGLEFRGRLLFSKKRGEGKGRH